MTKRPASLISRARDGLRKFSAEDLIQLRNERDNRGPPNIHKEPYPALQFIDRTQERKELQQALTPSFVRQDDKQSKVVVEYATISGAGKTRWMFQAFRKWSHYISDGTQLTASVVHLNFNSADGSNDCLHTRDSMIEPEDAVARLLLSRGLFESDPSLTWMGQGPVPESDLPRPSVIVDALFNSLFAEGKGLLVVHLDELHKLRTTRVGELTKVLVLKLTAKALGSKEGGKELTTKEKRIITEQAKAKAEKDVFCWITMFLGQICDLADHEKSRFVVPIITHTSPSGRVIGPDDLSALAYQPLRLYPLTMDQSWDLLNASRREMLKKRNDWHAIQERIQLDKSTIEMWSGCVALAGGHPALLLDSFHAITRTLDPGYNKDTRGHAMGQLVLNHRVEMLSMENIEVELAKSFVGKTLKMQEIMDDDTEFESIFGKGLAWYFPRNSATKARTGCVSSPFPYLLKLMERAGGVYKIAAHQLDPRNRDFQAAKAMEYIAALSVMLKECCDPDIWVETDIKKAKNGKAVLATQSENRPFMSVWPSSIEPGTDFGGKVRNTTSIMGGFTGILGRVKMQEPGIDSEQSLLEVMELAWFIGNQVKEGKLTIPVNAYFISSRRSPGPLANLVAAFRIAMSGCISKKEAEMEAKKFDEARKKSAAKKRRANGTQKRETRRNSQVDVRIVIEYLATSENSVLNPDYRFAYIGRGLQGMMEEGCVEMSTSLPMGIFASWYW